MRVLVTGGNRYIGLHLLFELARRGHDVTVANSHVAEMPEGCRRIHVDRRIPGALDEALGPHRDEFDVVFDNTAYTPDDLMPMVDLFAGRVQQFVFTSSVAVYRRNFVQPLTESARRHDAGDTNPVKSYGVNKVRCEDLLLDLYRDHGFPASVLRVTHTLGPRTPLVTREPNIFKRLEEGRPVLVPGDGYAMVHLVHVQDVAACMASLCGSDRSIGEVYNVSGDELASVEGCIRLMARAVGVEPTIVNVPRDLARQARRPLLHWSESLTGSAIYPNEHARRDLDWTPSFGLQDGYADSYRWFDSIGRDLFEYDFSDDDRLLQQLS
jgi:nucleoside-diphosphate-sugar epimerase